MHEYGHHVPDTDAGIRDGLDAAAAVGATPFADGRVVSGGCKTR
jgi:hypothetical protein